MEDFLKGERMLARIKCHPGLISSLMVLALGILLLQIPGRNEEDTRHILLCFAALFFFWVLTLYVIDRYRDELRKQQTLIDRLLPIPSCYKRK